VIGRLVVVVVGLVVLGGGCDSGSDGAGENRDRHPEDVPAGGDSPEVVEACRGVYQRLPQAERDATTEDEFIEQCLAAVSGRPDPGIPPGT
jgi:hypothetical protein